MANIEYKEGDWVRRINTNDYYCITYTSHRTKWYYKLNCVIMDGKIFNNIYNRSCSHGELKAFYKLANEAKLLYDK